MKWLLCESVNLEKIQHLSIGVISLSRPFFRWSVFISMQKEEQNNYCFIIKNIAVFPCLQESDCKERSLCRKLPTDITPETVNQRYMTNGQSFNIPYHIVQHFWLVQYTCIHVPYLMQTVPYHYAKLNQLLSCTNQMFCPLLHKFLDQWLTCTILMLLLSS